MVQPPKSRIAPVNRKEKEQLVFSEKGPEVPKMSLALLEAQQRYFSYRAILVAIVSQKYFVLVFMGYRILIARYIAKWGIAQMCLCELSAKGGITQFWGSAELPEKVSRDTGYRSDSIAVSRDMGPLSLLWSNPKVAAVQVWGCSRARNICGTPGGASEKTSCSFSYRMTGAIRDFGACTRQSGSHGMAALLGNFAVNVQIIDLLLGVIIQGLLGEGINHFRPL